MKRKVDLSDVMAMCHCWKILQKKKFEFVEFRKVKLWNKLQFTKSYWRLHWGSLDGLTWAFESPQDRSYGDGIDSSLSFSVGVVGVWNLRKSRDKGMALFRIGHAHWACWCLAFSWNHCPLCFFLVITQDRLFIPIFRQIWIYLRPLLLQWWHCI